MTLRLPHAFVAGACAGLALADVSRAPMTAAAVLALFAMLVGLAEPARRTAAVCVVAFVVSWTWGTARVAALDASVLRREVGRAERAVVLVTAPAHPTQYSVRANGEVVRFGGLRLHEPVLLELPRGRAPPQGARLDVLATVTLPRGPQNGFDERTWLRRHGIHLVLRVDAWRRVGRRGGIAGVPDRLRAWVLRGATTGLRGERRALVAGIVLGDDQGLSQELRDRFRASGLYHLLAVSGQNVALVALGVLWSAWLCGIPRVAAQLLALAGIAAYVVAVGAQPSVVRAGIAGALASLAWLAGRLADRWYALLVASLVLLAWNPYTLLDPGFQLSVVAVVAIFTCARPLRRILDGYPLPGPLADVVAISTVCGVATAPISWFEFHRIPLLTIPANALAAPVVAPLLAFALVAAVVAPVSLSAAALLAWLDGWCAAYLAACARLVGGLPGAQVTSPRGAAAVAAVALACAAYAWRRARRPEARLLAHRQRPSEDPNGARAPAPALRR